jgi:hypothetical protein
MRHARPRFWLCLAAFFLGANVFPLGTGALRGDPAHSSAELDSSNVHRSCAKSIGGSQSPNAGGLDCEDGPGKCHSY